MSSGASLIPAALTDACRRALDTHATRIAGLQVALLVTPDGFEIACLRIRGDLEASRLSAMASSLMAMAHAVSREIRSPPCKRLIFEAKGSLLLFQSGDAPTGCIHCLVLGSDAVLGVVLRASVDILRDVSHAA